MFSNFHNNTLNGDIDRDVLQVDACVYVRGCVFGPLFSFRGMTFIDPNL